MILPITLLALSALSAQANSQGNQLFPPKPQPLAPAANFMDWHGWAYLNGAPGSWPALYSTVGDWSDIQSKYTSLHQTKPSLWHIKLVVFTRTESDGRDSNGILREHRATIESTQLLQVTQAIQRFNAYVAAKFNGQVILAPDLEVESEWMRDSGRTAFGPDFARKYFEPRINGGSYEAEDKVFRGPFNSVIYVLPGTPAETLPDTMVNDTPVAAVPAVPMGANGEPASLDSALRDAWLREVGVRVKQQGFKGFSVVASGETSVDPWPTVTNLDDVAPQTFHARLSTTLDLPSGATDPTDVKLSQTGATDAKIVTDTERGQVLKVAESSGFREGGLALPARSDGMPLTKIEATPTLTFAVKSTSKDPVAIRLDSSDGKTMWVSVGRDPRLVAPMANTVVVDTPFKADGKWQSVSVDLRPTATQAGLGDVVRMAIEPTPNARLAGKLQPESVEYEFDAIKFSNDPVTNTPSTLTASATSEDADERALFAAQAKEASPALALLLKDKSELVRLNATSAYITIKDPTVEEQLIVNSLDLDPSVAVAALSALMTDGSDIARAVVKRSVSVSLSDYAKMMAGKLLGDTKDPKLADDISRLLSNHSWQAHVTAVEALAEIPTPESQIWRLGFIGMVDPAVKLAVTRNADPSVDRVLSAMLWSAVNEPSDMVRAQSYEKLIQASTPAAKAEGYKGVRDDSRYVRRLVVEYLAAHPSEDNRNALRIAIADRSAEVRAAAITGFAALEKGATEDEIANVLDDENSDVQLALIDFSKKKGMKLPPKTLQAMLASPDARVSTAAKGVGG